jgi:hypothetical protein
MIYSPTLIVSHCFYWCNIKTVSSIITPIKHSSATVVFFNITPFLVLTFHGQF